MTRLSDIRSSLEGAVPAVMATCAPDGTPNVTYLSQVYYVDEQHVALSFQFFNKTRANVLANPYATVLLIDPHTAAYWRLHLRYLRTETEGPLFEGMKAQLAGIASHSGLEGVFRLLGSDVYEVERIEAVPGDPLPAPPARAGLLGAVRCCAQRLARCTSLDEALNTVTAALTHDLGIEHSMILMLDAQAQRLYTVASSGYATSGVGSEIRLGEGVIGVAARECTPIRIGHMTHAASYSLAMRTSLEASSPHTLPLAEIPYPGLAHPHSQLAVPIASGGRALGVLFVESPQDLRFGFEDEDALVAIAGHLGAVIDLMQEAGETREAQASDLPAPPAGGPPLVARHFAANDSIFIGGEYLIKGVAGAILRKLLKEHAQGRSEFTNRELRLDPALGLPEVGDNLEARLVLLRKRLEEFGPDMRIEKTGRGRFRFVVARPVTLLERA